MPGPPPTPTEVLNARGSWRGKARANEPSDEVAAPTCPDWLDAEGKAEWRRLAGLLKKRRTIAKTARGVLALLCQNWSLFRRATERINAMLEGVLIDTMELKRWVAIQNSAAGVYMRAAAEFGLGPASRARVQTVKETGGKDSGKGRFFGTVG